MYKVYSDAPSRSATWHCRGGADLSNTWNTTHLPEAKSSHAAPRARLLAAQEASTDAWPPPPDPHSGL